MSGPVTIRRAMPSPVGPITTPVTPQGAGASTTGVALWQRVKAAAQAFSAPIFSPQQPVAPSSDTQVAGPRQFQYLPGANIQYVPRAEEGRTPFAWMLNLAEMLDTLNLALLYRTETISALDWQIVGRDPKRDPSQAQLSEAYARMAQPDGDLRTGQWLAALVWDSYVTDAASIYLPRSRAGDVLSWDLIEGATVKALLTGAGKRPQPPIPAFQQVLYGRPFWEGTTDDLLYAPKNPRPNSAYGHSPVEMVLLTINRLLRRQVFDAEYYSSGNVPEAIVAAPQEWSQDQIESTQAWFDTVITNPENRRRLHFLPSQNGRLGVFEFKRPTLDTAVEEFLDKRVFAIIGVSPQTLGFTNQVNKSTAGMQENADQLRAMPYIRFLSALLTELFRRSGLRDCVMQFAGEKPDEDKLVRAQIHDLYLKDGVMSVEDVWADTGMVSQGQRYLYPATGVAQPFPPTPAMLVPPAAPGAAPQPPAAPAAPDEPPPASAPAPGTANTPSAGMEGPTGQEAAGDAGVARQLAELRQWERRVQRQGVRGRPFVCRTLGPQFAAGVQTLLEEQPDAWRTVFAEARAVLTQEVVA